MSAESKDHRVAMIVVIIVLVGVLGAAIILSLIYRRDDRTVGETKPELLPTKVGEDGVPMVLIPARKMGFWEKIHGSHYDAFYYDAFYMDKYEVTNGAYKKFMDVTGHKAPVYWDDPRLNDPGHPVVGVSWHDADAYCKWAGKRLPTETEWEYAARGGVKDKLYPWGDEITHDNANYRGTGGRDQWEYTAPVGSFPPNGYGLYDMVGNVAEWCYDYCHDPHVAIRSARDFDIWINYNGGYFIRAELRFSCYIVPDSMFNLIGFRCAGQ